MKEMMIIKIDQIQTRNLIK